jgi:anti-sigma regulatory factor (Ser/Thr protein kinase)
MSENVAIEVKNSLSELERLAQIVDDFARRHQITTESNYKMKVALDEILTNVISYAYDDDGEHCITIRLQLECGKWIAEVEDDGLPFNPLNAPEPDVTQALDQRGVGGLGIHLVRKYMDELEYRNQMNRNILVMRLKVKGD